MLYQPSAFASIGISITNVWSRPAEVISPVHEADFERNGVLYVAVIVTFSAFERLKSRSFEEAKASEN